MADNFPLAVTPTVTGLQKFVQDNKEVQKTLDGTRAVADKTRGATRSSVFRTRNSTFAFQQLAFGVEDFTSVLGTQGLAGGLRAAGNNISQFASLISPLGGILAGLGVAAGAVALQFSGGPSDPFSAMKESAEQAKKNISGLVKNIESQLKLIRDAGTVDTQDKGIFLNFDFGDRSIQNAIDNLDRQGRRAAETMDMLRKKIAETRREMIRRTSQSGGGMGTGRDIERLSSELTQFEEELERLRQLEQGFDGTTGRAELRRGARERLEELRNELEQFQREQRDGFTNAIQDRANAASDREDLTSRLRREFNEAVNLAKQLFSGGELEEQLIKIKEAFQADAKSRIKEEKERKAQTRELPDSNLRTADTQDRLLRAQLGRTKTETEQLNETRKTNSLLRSLVQEIENSTPSVATFSGI